MLFNNFSQIESPHDPRVRQCYLLYQRTLIVEGKRVARAKKLKEYEARSRSGSRSGKPEDDLSQAPSVAVRGSKTPTQECLCVGVQCSTADHRAVACVTGDVAADSLKSSTILQLCKVVARKLRVTSTPKN